MTSMGDGGTLESSISVVVRNLKRQLLIVNSEIDQLQGGALHNHIHFSPTILFRVTTAVAVATEGMRTVPFNRSCFMRGVNIFFLLVVIVVVVVVVVVVFVL